MPTPSPTPLPVAPGDEDDDDAEVLGESVDDGDSDAATADDAASTEPSQDGSQDEATIGSDGGGDDAPASSDDGDVDEVAAPAIEGSAGVGGAQVAGILGAIALIGGGAFFMYRRSTRPTATHAE